MIYLLIVTLALAIGYALYLISFRNLTFFQWNRFYLLGMVLVSLLIPIGLFIDLSMYFSVAENLPTIHFTSVIDDVVVIGNNTSQAIYLIDFIFWFYWIGVGLCSILLLLKIGKLRSAFLQHPTYSSFSFFNKIVLGANVQDIQEINDHEKVHVQQGHSYDIVLLEIVGIFNWFNPIVYYIKKELKFQHECIADEICSTDKVSYAELLLAHAMHTDVNLLRHEFSNHSFLKKRIMMLFKNKSTNNKKLFYLFTLPLVGVLVLSTLVFNTSKAREFVQVVENKVEDVSLPSPKIEDISKGIADQPIEELQPVKIIDTAKRKQLEGGDELFVTTEINPEPPGEIEAFRKWIGENYQFPQEAIDAGLTGTLEVNFIVEKDGVLSDIHITKDLGFGTGEAAVALMKKSPKWSPAIQNGQAVRTAYTLPIRLDLSAMDVDNDNVVPLQDRVEVMAEPKGGISTFRKYIGDHLEYPKRIKDIRN